MPMWGDPDHNWKAIDDCVDILYKEIPEYILQAKEKFGFVRCYISVPYECEKIAKNVVRYTPLHIKNSIKCLGIKYTLLKFKRWLFNVYTYRDFRYKKLSFTLIGFTFSRSVNRGISKKDADALNDCFKDKYRNAYKKCLDKYPEMQYYILMDADYPKILEGLVKEEDCKHEGGWTCHKKDGTKTFRCGVCMREEIIDAKCEK